MRVAIIGMGTAGVSVLRQLVKNEAFKNLEVDVYDHDKNMGQGVPFQNDSSQLLINLPTKQMSLNLDDDEEFWKWYQEQSEFKFDNPKYLPRFVFGHYMKSYLSNYDLLFNNLTIIKHPVREIFTNSEIDETTLKYYVCTSEDMNQWKEYDYIFLTTGTFAYHDPYNLKGNKGYIQTPYPTYNTLDEVSQSDDIAIIGTGLASLDVVRYVATHHPKLPITMTSRSAHLPSVRGNMIDVEFKHLTKQKFNELKSQYYGNVPLELAFELFQLECKDHNIDLEKLVYRRTGNTIQDLQYDLDRPDEIGVFQSLIENIKENLNWIWNSFSREDQQDFDKRFSKIIQLNSNPMPPCTAELIIDLINNQSLIVKRGLEDITYKDNHYLLKFNNDDDDYLYDVIINTTGSKTHLSDLDEEDQLILNLQNRQIVQPHPMGGIQIIPETNQVISPRYGTLNNMIAIGQVTNGVNKLRNGVKMIVDQAVNSVNYLYENQSKFDHFNS
ncbi:FAD/NAD(P)-binding protein [Staphylococcus haemolyticus]|uniref:FAD/NAD(P)-binding protein n=1 Tax=Staphylococcus haemolyticus TaxID=1283 RepID=UPI002DBDACD4|nr:FAD/NAD(P)-binding protein [Staphylococcus haemolyticus]WRV65589.1 FAD/NAD(P)-binding protein [Staphylococcus haemolyticus]